MTDPKEIAAKLTYAEAEALRGVFAWATAHEQEQGEATLYRLGLWNPRPKYGQKAITPLGLAVRAVLQEKRP
jgi:GH18 family chitinase